MDILPNVLVVFLSAGMWVFGAFLMHEAWGTRGDIVRLRWEERNRTREES